MSRAWTPEESKTSYTDVLRRYNRLEDPAAIQRLMQNRVLCRKFIVSRTLKPP